MSNLTNLEINVTDITENNYMTLVVGAKMALSRNDKHVDSSRFVLYCSGFVWKLVTADQAHGLRSS